MVHHAGRVLEADATAQSRQVRPGTLLSEAKAVLQGQGRFVEYREEAFQEARDVWLDVCLEFSGAVEPGLAGEAWVDLSPHPDPVGTAHELAARLIESTGLTVQAGLAPAKWVARLAAGVCDPRAVRIGAPVIEPVQDAGAWLAPLPTGLLEPVDPAHREKLVFLGYRRIGQVATAPTVGLREQFGEAAFTIRRAAEGSHPDPVRASYPVESIFERIQFGHPLENRLALEAGLDELALRLAARLCASDRVAGALQLSLEFEDGPPAVARRALAKPWQAASPLRTALGVMLTGLKQDCPPVAAQALAHDLRRADLRQAALVAMPDPCGAQSCAEAAAKRLGAAYGVDTVVRASGLTVPRRVEVLREWRRATGWR